MRAASKSRGVAVRAARWFCACNLLAAALAAQSPCPGSITAVPNGSYAAGDHSQVDNNALSTASFTLSGSATATFVAGNCINLGTGFRATAPAPAGAATTTFHAWVDTAPTPVSVSPSNDSGLSQSFEWTVSSPSGPGNLSHVFALFNTTSNSTANACYIHYDPASNSLYLADNASGSWLGGFPPGTSGSASNSQCSISGNGASVITSGTNLTVTVPVTFQTSFSGNKYEYLFAINSANQHTEWRQMGTWTVPPPQYFLTTAVSPSDGGTISPASGPYDSGSLVTITATPADGYTFDGFSGDLSGSSPQSLVMNGPKSVTANFSRMLVSGAVNGSGPDLTVVSTVVPSFPNVPPPSGSLPSFSPLANVLINAATINTDPSLPPAVVQQNGGNNVAVFNVSSVSIPTGVTVEVGDFDYVVFNSAGAVSVTGNLQSSTVTV
jgi:hypothetical protein